MEYYMTDERITEYLKALENEERAAATVEKYRRALLSFAAFLSGAAVTPEMIRLWKDNLRARNYVPSTINTYLAALNGFFRFCGWADCRARFLKIQRRLFRDSKQELTRAEYERLVAAAEAAGDRGLALLMETICSTGIRVSEVRYITVEAAKNGKTEIALKGKIRTILLPAKLCRIFERRSGHAGDDPPLEGRPAREKLRAIDHQRLSGCAERILPFLRLGGLLRTVSQDPAPPVPRQQTGVNARRI